MLLTLLTLTILRSNSIKLCFEIYSTLTFGKIKTITREHCKKHRAWLQAHLSSTWQMIDVVSIGHLHGKHPRFANIDGLHAQVEAFFTQAASSSEAMTKFPLFYDEEKLNLPSFYLNKGVVIHTVNNQKLKADVIEIHTARVHSDFLKYLVDSHIRHAKHHERRRRTYQMFNKG